MEKTPYDILTEVLLEEASKPVLSPRPDSAGSPQSDTRSPEDITNDLYEKLRKRMLNFFRYKGCVPYEDLAGEAMDRLAMAVAKVHKEGGRIGSIHDYSSRVAEYIYLEHLKEIKQQQKFESIDPGDDEDPLGGRSIKELPERRESVDPILKLTFEKCKQGLPKPDRRLFEAYHQADDNKEREQVAKQFGISYPTLRVRTHRIREKLEECVNAKR